MLDERALDALEQQIIAIRTMADATLLQVQLLRAPATVAAPVLPEIEEEPSGPRVFGAQNREATQNVSAT